MSWAGKYTCTRENCLLAGQHQQGSPGCSGRAPPHLRSCTKKGCPVKEPHMVESQGCTGKQARPDITVFEMKGRRATTRAKEERGGGRRNASRPKEPTGPAPRCISPSCPQAAPHLVDAPDCMGYPFVWGSGWTMQAAKARRKEGLKLDGLVQEGCSCFSHALAARHETLKVAVRELLAARHLTGGAFNLGVKGAARKAMLKKEQKCLEAAWAAVERLVES